jgi:hypothetical protein
VAKTLLEQGQKLAQKSVEPVKKKRAITVMVETGKGKVGYGRKFEHGQVGAEIELEKDQKPKYKGVGSFEWD